MNTNVEETTISNGIREFEKFKAIASEAIERCKKAEEQAEFLRGQNELLTQQHASAEARHQNDLLRIAELESFVSTVIDSYRTWEEKLRLGHFRRATSTRATQETYRIPANTGVAINTGGSEPQARRSDVDIEQEIRGILRGGT